MDEAIEVLRAAVGRSGDAMQTGADVRRALKTLRFVVIPSDAIRYFWESCGTENEIGRSQNMSAAFRRIELFRSGQLSRDVKDDRLTDTDSPMPIAGDFQTAFSSNLWFLVDSV